ncbi:MAG TPA: class I SAM-dependent methyltransferase [Acidimicrobiales bacterium]|jgi:SAM-dependent methyltransferase|nr:class I SAM-dependent methyltransferase [Acidimicrobiales bacterium]
MATLPPERAPIPGHAAHHARQIAESFGSNPDRYDRARPGYPQTLVDRIIAASPGLDVLDVGMGTGIVARLFRAAGCQLLGVEVDPRMAESARRSGLEVEVAKFEDWDPSGRGFDAVVAGQTWHWIDPVAGAAKAADALRPGGRLAVFWNADQPRADLAEAFGEVYRRVTPDSLVARRWTVVSAVDGYSTTAVDGYSALGAQAVEGMRVVGAFDDPEQWRFGWERSYGREEWLDQVPTTGDHSLLPPWQLEELLAGIGSAIDAVGGSFTMRYSVLVATAARTDIA